MQPPKENPNAYCTSFLVRMQTAQIVKLRDDAKTAGMTISAYVRSKLGLDQVVKNDG